MVNSHLTWAERRREILRHLQRIGPVTCGVLASASRMTSAEVRAKLVDLRRDRLAAYDPDTRLWTATGEDNNG